jgi:high-affinity iron transporter
VAVAGHTQTEVAREQNGAAGTVSWSADGPGTASGLPGRLTVTQLLRFTGQRVPVGLDIHRSPGPYRATWDDRTRLHATTYDGGLVSASRSGSLVLTLSGGGLTSERVLTVTDPAGLGAWHVPAAYAAQMQDRIAAAEATHDDRTLWKYWFPGFLAALAAWLLISGLRSRAALRAAFVPTGGQAAATDAPAAAGRPGRNHHVSTTG